MDCTVHGITKSWTRLSDFHTQMMLKSSKHLMLSNSCFHFCSFQPNLCFWFKSLIMYLMRFPGGSDGKASACNVRDLGSFRFLGQEDPLEKEMAIHSSTLAWKSQWMQEPDWLQSMASQRVGHDWATSLSLPLTFKIKMPETLPNRWIVMNVLLNEWNFSTWFAFGPNSYFMEKKKSCFLYDQGIGLEISLC